jgi:ribonuclease-3
MGGRPVYTVLEAVGPDHDKVFRVEVAVGGEILGMGVGRSRRVAETAAAAEAVEILAARHAERAEDLIEGLEEATDVAEAAG